MSGNHYHQTAFVAMGSNYSQNTAKIKSLLDDALAEIGTETTLGKTSPFYVTPCFPAGAGPDFVNAVTSFQTALEPDAVLALLHRIETAFGRTRTTRWGQRSLDLDLLALGARIAPDMQAVKTWMDLPLDQQMTDAPQQLIMPHPRIQDRSFVLGPWRDIAPDWRHPILGQTVAQMWTALPEADRSSIRPLSPR